MKVLEKRQEALETRFVLAALNDFKAKACRNKMIAAWAAPLMGKDSDEYFKDIVKADCESPIEGRILRKVKADLDAVKFDIDSSELRQKMDGYMKKARTRVIDGIAS